MDFVKKVLKWEYISEGILIVELNIEDGRNTTVVASVQNDDETVSRENDCLDELTSII